MVEVPPTKHWGQWNIRLAAYLKRLFAYLCRIFIVGANQIKWGNCHVIAKRISKTNILQTDLQRKHHSCMEF